MVFIRNYRINIMKKNYYLCAVVVLALVIVLPMTTRAEDDAGDPNLDNGVQIQVDASTRTTLTPRPGTSKPTPYELLKKATNVNIKNNEDSRNRNLEEKRKIMGSTTISLPGMKNGIRIVASTTRANRPEINEDRREINDDRRENVKDIREEGREDIKNASSSGERREIRKDMRKDEFKARKDAIVKQLGITLKNLKQIRERISLRIEKASTEGRDMTNAKSLLIVADSKITMAEQAIGTVMNFNPVISATTTASSTIDIIKPREVGETAIKALKQAREALVDVVRAIAHAMGLGNATTTPPVVTPPATTTTASTTTTI